MLFEVTMCPEGMVYKQCGPICTSTCDSDALLYIDRYKSCEEGCFCPDGTVLYSGQAMYWSRKLSQAWYVNCPLL